MVMIAQSLCYDSFPGKSKDGPANVERSHLGNGFYITQLHVKIINDQFEDRIKRAWV